MRAIAVSLGIIVTGFVALILLAVVVPSEPGVETASAIPLADPGDMYDPVQAGESLPSGFRQLIPRDGILPVYAPEFVGADDVGWSDDDLVIGVEIDGESRAYPVAFLNRREMVVDSIAGIPVLVTW